MNPRKLKKLRRKVVSLRNRISNIKPNELERLAKSLGRLPVKRGKEPTYESECFHCALTIPNHGNGILNKFTAGNILDQLEQDIIQLEENLKEE